MTPEFDRVLQIGILRSCRCAEAAWIIPLRLTVMPKRHHKGGAITWAANGTQKTALPRQGS
jgi:hypothetical protein